MLSEMRGVMGARAPLRPATIPLSQLLDNLAGVLTGAVTINPRIIAGGWWPEGGLSRGYRRQKRFLMRP